MIPIATSGAVLRAPKASERLARLIVRDISAGGFGPGDALESELAMMRRYNSSRESLREALRLLEVQGMLTIRRGPHGGPVVGTVDPASLGRIGALFYHLAGATYDELFDAWVFGESALARMAAKHPDPDIRSTAMAPYLDGSHGQEEDLARFVEDHEGFHGAVASLAGNRVLELSLRAFGQLVAHHVATVGDPRSMGETLTHDHGRIAASIADGYHRGAEELMAAHLRDVCDLNRSMLGELVRGKVEWL